jgi:hypothetical protein
VTEEQARQRADLVALVNRALGFRVSCDGSDNYHLERLRWRPSVASLGETGHEVEVVTTVRPATKDEYRMYQLLCSPQADWAGDDDGQDTSPD